MTNASVHLRLSDEHDTWLTDQAKLRGVSKAFIIARALDVLRELEPEPSAISIEATTRLARAIGYQIAS